MKQVELKDIAQSCIKKLQDSIKNSSFHEEPFKHLVIDNFFPEHFANDFLNNFPDVKSPLWERTNDKY
jgi:hypothetical protein